MRGAEGALQRLQHFAVEAFRFDVATRRRRDGREQADHSCDVVMVGVEVGALNFEPLSRQPFRLGVFAFRDEQLGEVGQCPRDDHVAVAQRLLERRRCAPGQRLGLRRISA